MGKKSRIMYIECKGEWRDSQLAGPARIGRVTFSKSGKSLHYQGKTFASLKGAGSKANYMDEETLEVYWISGCRKDGTDALYNTDVEIDEDVREKYWEEIRGIPENRHISSFRARGKYQASMERNCDLPLCVIGHGDVAPPNQNSPTGYGPPPART